MSEKSHHWLSRQRRNVPGPKREDIINRQLCHFFRADVNSGTAVAKVPGVDVDAVMKELQHEDF